MKTQKIGAVLNVTEYDAKVMRGLAVSLSLALLPCTISHAAEPETIQPQERFEAAMLNGSTSPNLILLTIVDDRTGNSWVGCTLAPLLTGAIIRERDAVSVQEAIQIAISNASHIFHFSKQSALDNLRDITAGKYNKACDTLKRVGCVRRQDLTGAFVPC